MPEIKYTVGLVLNDRKRIVSAAGRNKHKQPVYMWECLGCGGVYGPRTGTDIARSIYSKCCPRRGSEKTNYTGYRDITGQRFSQIKWGASSRNIEFAVTIQHIWSIWEQQNGRCVYTGRKLTHGLDASLDRIDSALGYVVGNVQWVHKTINKMKWELSDGDFLSICEEIVKYRLGENHEHLDT